MYIHILKNVLYIYWKMCPGCNGIYIYKSHVQILCPRCLDGVPLDERKFIQWNMYIYIYICLYVLYIYNMYVYV